MTSGRRAPLLALAIASALSGAALAGDPAKKEGVSMRLEVTSAAFTSGATIPTRFTGDGADVSPPLKIARIPEAAAELALICDDPDAPRAEPWVHWVIYGIPKALGALPEGVPAERTLASLGGARQGTNDFGKIGYGGPAPPRGHGPHHYHFKAYALDRKVDLGPGAKKADVEKAIAGHVLAEGELVGVYERKR